MRKEVYTKHYFACHTYIYRNHPKAAKCENPDCKAVNPTTFNWALKKGKEYSKDINDYWQLCRSCHNLYDFTEETRLKMSTTKKGKKQPYNTGVKHFKSQPINQYDLDGNFIKQWESINSCAVGLDIHKIGILNCLKGKMKQSFGFKFAKVMLNGITI